MLAFRTGRGIRLKEVAPYLLQQARERKGQWKVTVYGMRGGKYTVVYSEEEYSKLSRTMYHGLRNGTKTSQFHAGLENVAQTLWPTGSLDHVAMRHVGVSVLLRYVTTHTGKSWIPWRCFGLNRKLPKLDRLESGEAILAQEDKGAKKPSKGEGKKPRNGGDSKSSSSGAGGKPSDDSGDDKPPPKLDTPSTPEDDEVGAGVAEDGRTIIRGDVVAVVGQNFDKSAPINHMPIVGLLVGPCQAKPNVYSKTADNLKAAIDERITKKAKKPNLDKTEKTRLGNVVRTAMSGHKTRGVFSKGRIREWANQHFNLEECKSGKWSLPRFRGSLENLYAKEHPTFAFKADIKLECMPEGKAPRMLIADGDEGQLMALAVVKCFEELVFEHFENRSIKHLPKREALDRVVRELKRPGAKAVEGDGSAWDTTCNVLIRSLVENPVLRHIFEVLAGYGVIPEAWMEEHSRACEQKKLRLFFTNKFETLSVSIDAIRRSGHRGTSCLNWWMNFVMWVSSVFKEAERFLDVSVRRGEDLAGIMRWWSGCFEGDDSLCTMKPPMEEGDKLSEIFLKFWSSAGFNMKIVFCKDRATFVGWHIGCTEGEINDFRSPELPRALANSGVSVSTQAVKTAKEGSIKAARTLAAASALARASDFSGILPSVSAKYLDYAESLSTSDFEDREMSFRAFGEDGHSAQEVRAGVRERNLVVTPQEELATLKALGYSATHDEIATFREYVWSMDPSVLTDYDSFRESLPPTWRVS
jgi:hypothetical protein